MKNQEMVSLHVKIPRKLHKDLKLLAIRRGCTLTEVVIRKLKVSDEITTIRTPNILSKPWKIKYRYQGGEYHD